MSEQTPRFTMDKCPDCGSDMADAGPPIGFYCSLGKDCPGWKRMGRTYRPDDEVATLTARCEALEAEKGRLDAKLDSYLMELTETQSRCEALAAERDTLLAERQNILRSMFEQSEARQALFEENKRAAVMVADYLSRCQHLEQVIRDLLEIGKRDLSNPKYNGYFDALASLLPTQEEDTTRG